MDLSPYASPLSLDHHRLRRRRYRKWEWGRGRRQFWYPSGHLHSNGHGEPARREPFSDSSTDRKLNGSDMCRNKRPFDSCGQALVTGAGTSRAVRNVCYCECPLRLKRRRPFNETAGSAQVREGGEWKADCGQQRWSWRFGRISVAHLRSQTKEFRISFWRRLSLLFTVKLPGANRSDRREGSRVRETRRRTISITQRRAESHGFGAFSSRLRLWSHKEKVRSSLWRRDRYFSHFPHFDEEKFRCDTSQPLSLAQRHLAHVEGACTERT